MAVEGLVGGQAQRSTRSAPHLPSPPSPLAPLTPPLTPRPPPGALRGAPPQAHLARPPRARGWRGPAVIPGGAAAARPHAAPHRRGGTAASLAPAALLAGWWPVGQLGLLVAGRLAGWAGSAAARAARRERRRRQQQGAGVRQWCSRGAAPWSGVGQAGRQAGRRRRAAPVTNTAIFRTGAQPGFGELSLAGWCPRAASCLTTKPLHARTRTQEASREAARTPRVVEAAAAWRGQ